MSASPAAGGFTCRRTAGDRARLLPPYPDALLETTKCCIFCITTWETRSRFPFPRRAAGRHLSLTTPKTPSSTGGLWWEAAILRHAAWMGVRENRRFRHSHEAQLGFAPHQNLAQTLDTSHLHLDLLRGHGALGHGHVGMTCGVTQRSYEDRRGKVLLRVTKHTHTHTRNCPFRCRRPPSECKSEKLDGDGLTVKAGM